MASQRITSSIFGSMSLYDYVFVEIIAEAHLLVAEALLNPDHASGKVDGKAFIPTDSKAVHFWDMKGLIWNTDGEETRPEGIQVETVWLCTAVVIVTE